MIAIYVIAVWALLLGVLWAAKAELLRSTWKEPYLKDLAVVIESDDWGPGPALHAKRLQGLTDSLARHRDAAGRSAVLTANLVLAVPDTIAIRAAGLTRYVRRSLDQGFEAILDTLRAAMKAGTLVPQIHGAEHLYGAGLVRLTAQGDSRTEPIFEQDDWFDWEALDSPLQGHYVDGTNLPTRPLGEEEQREQITAATRTFSRLLAMESRSTAAPCYLWQDATEKLWHEQGIRYIQTAGYRCKERDQTGAYVQDRRLIKPGDRNELDQIYLVRNAMYEPKDGRDAERCATEALRAFRQALPVVISTHRYNYTGGETDYHSAVLGLSKTLGKIRSWTGRTRYLSSPELGAWLDGDAHPLTNPATGQQWPTLEIMAGPPKLSAFLSRLWYRHAKLRVASVVTGLIVPLALIAALARLAGKRRDGR